MRAGYQRPDNVAYVVEATEDGDVVYLSVLPGGSLLVLRGTSALIWQQAIASGSADVVSDVALAAGLTADVVREDVESFVDLLVGRRLLEAVGR